MLEPACLVPCDSNAGWFSLASLFPEQESSRPVERVLQGTAIELDGPHSQLVMDSWKSSPRAFHLQTEAQEVPSAHEEELLPSEGDGALEQAAQGGCGVSPSLEIFKTRLDKVLCSLL